MNSKKPTFQSYIIILSNTPLDYHYWLSFTTYFLPCHFLLLIEISNIEIQSAEIFNWNRRKIIIIDMKFFFPCVFFGYVFADGIDSSGYAPNLPTYPDIKVNLPDVKQTIPVPQFPTANINQLRLGSSSSGDAEQNTLNAINNARKEISTSVRSFESLFVRHPSKSQLNKFAEDGDSSAISRTLQNLASDDSIPCQTKISYLLQVLAAIKKAIANKNLAADQLQSIVEGAKAEIKRLQDQIQRTQKERDSLNLAGLQNKVNQFVTKLRSLYNQINAIRVQIPPEQARITGYQREIATLSKQNDEERNRISNDKLKLAQTDNLIRQLEGKIKQAKAQKSALEASISASQITIKDNNTKISNIRNTIADINRKIRILQDTLDKLRRESNSLQVDQERSRTDLAVAQSQDKLLLEQQRGYKSRISSEHPKLVEDQLKKIKIIIQNLLQSMSQVYNQVDRQYYYCYGAGKVETITTGNVLIYVVKGEAFGHYIQTAYGQTVHAPNIKTGSDYKLQVVDPYSKIWTAKYGYPWVTGGKGDFSCLTGNGSTNSGSGIITGVQNNGIIITDAQGNNVTLNVGSCSRLESTEDLPKIGQNLAWRGVPSSNSGYNIYSATCW